MGGVGTFGVVACVQEVAVTPGELLADADLIRYTRGASEKDGEEAIRKPLRLSVQPQDKHPEQMQSTALSLTGMERESAMRIWRLDKGPLWRNLSCMSGALQYLTDQTGKKTAVVLPISDYEKLLEDLEDLATLAERREEPTMLHEQFKADLKRDGILSSCSG